MAFGSVNIPFMLTRKEQQFCVYSVFVVSRTDIDQPVRFKAILYSAFVDLRPIYPMWMVLSKKNQHGFLKFVVVVLRLHAFAWTYFAFVVGRLYFTHTFHRLFKQIYFNASYSAITYICSTKLLNTHVVIIARLALKMTLQGAPQMVQQIWKTCLKIAAMKIAEKNVPIYVGCGP